MEALALWRFPAVIEEQTPVMPEANKSETAGTSYLPQKRKYYRFRIDQNVHLYWRESMRLYTYLTIVQNKNHA
jgi:hypothetical protein